MEGFTFEQLINDEKSRTEFFNLYRSLIDNCKKYGFIESAIIHANKQKDIMHEIELLL